MPVTALFIESPAGNDIVNMGMIVQLPAPGMEDAEKTGGVTADEFIISGKFFQR